VIIGSTGLDLTLRLEVEKLSQRSAFRRIEILLHQGERNARAPRQLPSKSHRRVNKIAVRNYPIDHSQRERL